MSKYSIKVTGGGRLDGEYEGAQTLLTAYRRAQTEFVPFVAEHNKVWIVTFSKDGERVHYVKQVHALRKPARDAGPKTRAWELWWSDGEERGFVEAFSDKGTAQRRARMLKKAHPRTTYYLKHAKTPLRMQWDKRGTRRGKRASKAAHRRFGW